LWFIARPIATGCRDRSVDTLGGVRYLTIKTLLMAPEKKSPTPLTRKFGAQFTHHQSMREEQSVPASGLFSYRHVSDIGLPVDTLE
jgi:hypothetical protein